MAHKGSEQNWMHPEGTWLGLDVKSIHYEPEERQCESKALTAGGNRESLEAHGSATLAHPVAKG